MHENIPSGSMMYCGGKTSPLTIMNGVPSTIMFFVKGAGLLDKATADSNR